MKKTFIAVEYNPKDSISNNQMIMTSNMVISVDTDTFETEVIKNRYGSIGKVYSDDNLKNLLERLQKGFLIIRKTF